MGLFQSKQRTEEKSRELASVDQSVEMGPSDKDFPFETARAFVERLLWLQEKHKLFHIDVESSKSDKKTKVLTWSAPSLGFGGLKHGHYVYSEHYKGFWGKVKGRRYYYATV